MDLVVGVALGRLWCTEKPPGGVPRMLLLRVWRFFDGKCRPKGRFLDPRKIGNRSKTALLRIGWHFDPRKMASGRGFGKNMKSDEKSMRKLILFEGSEAAFLLENVESGAFSPFSEKVKKSMPKGTSKVIVSAGR